MCTSRPHQPAAMHSSGEESPPHHLTGDVEAGAVAEVDMAAEATVAAAVVDADLDLEAAVAAVVATAAAPVAAATAASTTSASSAIAAATSEPARAQAADPVLLGHMLTSQLIGGLRHESPTPGCSLESDFAKIWKNVIFPVAARTDGQVVILFALLLLLGLITIAVFVGVYVLS